MLDEVAKVFAGVRSRKMPLRTEYKRVFVHVGKYCYVWTRKFWNWHMDGPDFENEEVDDVVCAR